LRENKYTSRDIDDLFKLRKRLDEPEFKYDEKGLSIEEYRKLGFDYNHSDQKLV